jgi:hypothetical protein
VNPLNGAYAQPGCLITSLFLFVFAAFGCQASTTVTNFIAPVDCATIYSSGSVLRITALTMGSSTEGGLDFAAFDPSPYSAVQLEISPQGSPVLGNTVQVYGIDGQTSTLVGSDYGSGTSLGSFPVAANTPDGQPLLFDITSFVRSVKGPYFAIVFKAGPDLFGATGDYTSQPPGLFVVGPAPVLQLTAAARAGNQFIITWPTNNSTGLTLKSSGTLGNNAAWSPVNPAPVRSGNQWVVMVTNSVSGTNRFFQLSSP